MTTEALTALHFSPKSWTSPSSKGQIARLTPSPTSFNGKGNLSFQSLGHKKPVGFHETLKADYHLRNEQRKLENDTNRSVIETQALDKKERVKSPESSFTSSASSTQSLSEDTVSGTDSEEHLRGEEGREGIHLMPTSAAFQDVMKPVEVGLNFEESGEGAVHTALKGGENPEQEILNKVNSFDGKEGEEISLSQQLGTDTVEGEEKGDGLLNEKKGSQPDSKDLKQEKAVEQAAKKETVKVNQEIAAEATVKGTDEGEKLARQVGLSSLSGQVKVKVTSTPGENTQRPASSLNTLIGLQESDSGEEVSIKPVVEAHSSETAYQDKTTSDFMKTGSEGKGMVLPTDSKTSTAPSPLVTETAPVSADFQMNLQAGGKAEISQLPLYTSQNPNVASQVAQNLLTARQEGQTKFFIQMNPANLGKVHVDMELKGGRVKAIFSSAEKQTLSLLKQESGALLDSLQEMGFEIDSEGLDFSLMDKGEGGSRDELSFDKDNFEFGDPLKNVSGEESMNAAPRIDDNRLYDAVA